VYVDGTMVKQLDSPTSQCFLAVYLYLLWNPAIANKLARASRRLSITRLLRVCNPYSESLRPRWPARSVTIRYNRIAFWKRIDWASFNISANVLKAEVSSRKYTGSACFSTCRVVQTDGQTDEWTENSVYQRSDDTTCWSQVTRSTERRPCYWSHLS